MKLGLLWFDADNRVSLQKRLAEAATRFAERFGRPANCCHVNPEQLFADEAIAVVANPAILKHHFWVGRDEALEPERPRRGRSTRKVASAPVATGTLLESGPPPADAGSPGSSAIEAAAATPSTEPLVDAAPTTVELPQDSPPTAPEPTTRRAARRRVSPTGGEIGGEMPLSEVQTESVAGARAGGNRVAGKGVAGKGVAGAPSADGSGERAPIRSRSAKVEPAPVEPAPVEPAPVARTPRAPAKRALTAPTTVTSTPAKSSAVRRGRVRGEIVMVEAVTAAPDGGATPVKVEAAKPQSPGKAQPPKRARATSVSATTEAVQAAKAEPTVSESGLGDAPKAASVSGRSTRARGKAVDGSPVVTVPAPAPAPTPSATSSTTSQQSVLPAPKPVRRGTRSIPPAVSDSAPTNAPSQKVSAKQSAKRAADERRDAPVSSRTVAARPKAKRDSSAGTETIAAPASSVARQEPKRERKRAAPMSNEIASVATSPDRGSKTDKPEKTAGRRVNVVAPAENPALPAEGRQSVRRAARQAIEPATRKGGRLERRQSA